MNSPRRIIGDGKIFVHCNNLHNRKIRDLGNEIREHYVVILKIKLLKNNENILECSFKDKDLETIQSTRIAA